jgi:hypothetical protein
MGGVPSHDCPADILEQPHVIRDKPADEFRAAIARRLQLLLTDH